MKRILTLICLVPLIYLSACKDKDDNPEIEVNPFEACRITDIQEYEDVVNFNYNDSGLATAIEYTYYSFNCDFDFDLDETVCDSTLVSTEIKFTYLEDRISGASVSEDGVVSSDNLTIGYDSDDRLNKLTFTYSYEDEDDVDEYRFVYNAEGKVIKIENYDNYGTNSPALELYGYEVYEYNQNNISKIEYFYESFNSRERKQNKKWFSRRQNSFNSRVAQELSSTVLLTTDQKINPFFGNIPFLLYSTAFPFFLNENNVLTYVETETGENGDSFSAQYTYEYNNQNFPTVLNATLFREGFDDEEFRSVINYECK